MTRKRPTDIVSPITDIALPDKVSPVRILR